MITIRCSSIGYIMTDPRSGKGLSETCKTHLVDLFVADKYDRHTDIFNKYVEKGLAVEEDSITLYSRVKKRYFQKNTERLKNDWINGEPDLFIGPNIQKAETIIDIKSSWDLYTFTRARYSPVNKHYWWQLQGYMALTGAKQAILAYCLVNTPETTIADEKRKLLWRMGITTEENQDFKDACAEIDKNMRYDDIAMTDRVFETSIQRDEQAIEAIYARVGECRDYYYKTFPVVMVADHDKEVGAIIVQ